MIAKRQIWNYQPSVKVWVGKYQNSHNLLHWHSDCELLYVEKGEVDIFCEKQSHRLGEGETLFVDSGQVHYMHASAVDTCLIVIIFDRDILKPYIGEVRLSSPRLKHRYPIPAVYGEIRDVLLKGEPFCGGEAAGKVISLMSVIFRGEDLVPREAGDRTELRFIRLLEEIGEKYEFYTFADAVSFMGMSEAYFSRYFRAETGISFTKYLNHVRIENAVNLLHAKRGLSMTEISSRCGFSTIRNFNRIFKEITGYAPSELPPDFEMSDSFVYPSEASFNPTLHDCELIESGSSET